MNNVMTYPNDMDWKTIRPGDRVVIPAGDWDQPIRLNGVRGTKERPVVVEGEPGAVLDLRTNEDVGVELTDCRFVTVRGLTIRRPNTAAIVLRHSSYCRVERCRIELCAFSPIVVRGYSMDLPPNPMDPWQWYKQLPVAAGNVFEDNSFDYRTTRPTPPPEIDLEYAHANRFVNNGVRRARLARSCGNDIIQATPCELDETDFAVNNIVARQPRETGVSLREIAREMPGQDRFWKVAREGLKKFTDFSFACSDERLERLVHQTFYLLAGRVDADGRCPISPPAALYAALEFPNDPNVAHGFDKIIHGRDSLVAAETLMTLGALELGERIARFMTRHGVSAAAWGAGDTARPWDGQTQIDVPCHLFSALHRHWKQTGRMDLVEPLVDAVAAALRADERLYDGQRGLYRVGANEYLGIGIPMFGQAENCFRLDAFRKLAEVAGVCGKSDLARWATERSARLREGIETHLKAGAYCMGTEIRGDQLIPIEPVGQNSELVALRAFPDCDPVAKEKTYLATLETITPWGDHDFPMSRFQDQRGLLITMGMDIGAVMAHEARTGRLESLWRNLIAILELTTKPAYVLPDHWEFFRSRDLDCAWRGYAQKPDGQYTMGVGNCLHSSEWLLYLRNDFLGIRDTGPALEIAPSLPFEIQSYAVANAPTVGPGIIGYRLERGEREVLLEVSGQGPQTAVRFSVPVPRGAKAVTVQCDGGRVKSATRAQNDVLWAEFEAPSRQCSIRLDWE